MNTWRFIVDSPQSAAVNMATDEAIAIAFSEQRVPHTLRFYRWSQLAFSIGSFQKLETTWIEQFEKASLAGTSDDPLCTLVRRMTGGRALLHDREFTYSLTASNNNPLFSSGIRGAYFAIAKALLLGLNKLGLDAQIHSPPSKKRKTGARDPLCFAASSRYEITAEGKKLIGSAQRRWATHFLQHGSLILEKSPLLTTQPTWLGMPLSSSDEMTLSNLLPQLPSHKNLIEAMKSGFESALSMRLEPSVITAYEQNLVKTLVAEKYGNAAWNLRRERKLPG